MGGIKRGENARSNLLRVEESSYDQQIVPDDTPRSVLFSEYSTLYDWVAREVEGLTEAQLDFSSNRWPLFE